MHLQTFDAGIFQGVSKTIPATFQNVWKLLSFHCNESQAILCQGRNANLNPQRLPGVNSCIDPLRDNIEGLKEQEYANQCARIRLSNYLKNQFGACVLTLCVFHL